MITKEIYEELKAALMDDISKLFNYDYTTALNDLILAFNRYCDDECNGEDHLYNIHNHDDLCALVQGGMSALTIASVCKSGTEIVYGSVSFVSICEDSRDSEKKIYRTYRMCDLQDLLRDNLSNIIFHVLNSPDIPEYKTLYVRYVQSYIMRYKEC